MRLACCLLLLQLHLLLHLEELQQEVDVRSYDMQGVELLRSGKFLALAVPGLAEARPSVLHGDALYVSSGGSKEWQGIVHVVRQEEVRGVMWWRSWFVLCIG